MNKVVKVGFIICLRQNVLKNLLTRKQYHVIFCLGRNKNWDLQICVNFSTIKHFNFFFCSNIPTLLAEIVQSYK